MARMCGTEGGGGRDGGGGEGGGGEGGGDGGGEGGGEGGLLKRRRSGDGFWCQKIILQKNQFQQL